MRVKKVERDERNAMTLLLGYSLFDFRALSVAIKTLQSGVADAIAAIKGVSDRWLKANKFSLSIYIHFRL